MQVLEFGRHLLFLSVFLTGGIFLLSILGVLLKDRRFVVTARVGFYSLLVTVGGSSACLVHGFLTGQYNYEYIYQYSEESLATPYKIAGLWAGLNGSILFWSLILAGFSALAAFQHRWSARHPVGRRLEPHVYIVLSIVLFFFILVTHQVANPFKEFPLAERLMRSPDGIIADGHGLNPQLENYWMAIHPPTLYLGLVGFTVPFAFAMASLMAGEMGDYWIKITRRWTLIAWTVLTVGIILGGVWAYEMLGWGGYWAWDPVENASILPWFVGTAFLHSVMVQERRDMLKGWNVFLIMLTFFMTIVATYMTRSGVVSSVHAFAEGTVGNWFLPFMLGTAVAGAFLIGWRLPFLRGKHQLESYLSREAAFFFNNLILLALCGTVFFLSMFEKISHDFLLTKLKTGIPVYTIVTTPLFLLLLLLTGLGPQLGWVKTSPKVLWRRILWPGLFGLVVSLALIPQWVMHDTIPSPWAATGGGGTGLDAWSLVEKLHYYSTLAGVGLSVFIVGTVIVEYYRAVRARLSYRQETVIGSGLRVLLGNNRRYGGYVVHVGLALTAIGIIWSSNFRVKDEMKIGWQQPQVIEGTGYSVVWNDLAKLPTGLPYWGEAVQFVITRDGREVTTLRPEMRRYDKQNNTISIPAISRNFINDYYIHYSMRNNEPGQGNATISFTIFLNPLINWIWTGAILMLLGGIFAALPMPRRRLGLVD